MSQNLKNVMEMLVAQRLEEIKDRLPGCKCDICLQDITAHALNHLEPKYVATHTGELYTKADALTMQNEIDLTSALVKSAEIVSKNPRH